MSTQDPHRHIESRFLITFFGLIMLTGGTQLWINILGGTFMCLGIARLLWVDVYKALT